MGGPLPKLTWLGSVCFLCLSGFPWKDLIYMVKSRFWLVVALLMCSFPVMAKDYLLSSEIYEDFNGLSQIQEVVNSDFSSFQEIFIGGYSPSVFWIRLNIAPASDGQAIQIRIRPTFLDKVDLYTPNLLSRGNWIIRSTGDTVSFASSERNDISLGFVVTPSHPYTTYYLRLETTSTALISVQALSLNDAKRRDAIIRMFHLLALTFVGATVVWGFYVWRTFGFRLAGSFALFQTLNYLYLFFVTGKAAPLEPDAYAGLVNLLTSSLILLLGLSWIWLMRHLFMTYKVSRAFLYFFDGMLVTSLILLVLYYSGYAQFALKFNSVIVLIVSAGSFFIACVHRSATDQLPSVIRLRVVLGLLLIVFWMALMPYIGFEVPVQWTLETNVGYGFTTALLMMMIVLHKSFEFRVKLQEQVAQFVRVNAELENERKHATSQRQLIDMMTHEIKNSLSTAMMSLGAIRSASPYAERARQSLRNIDTLTERIAMTEMTEQNQVTPTKHLLNLSALVQQCIAVSTMPSRFTLQAPAIINIESDEMLLSVIINNLIDNALKYAVPDSDIGVKIEVLHGSVCLSVFNFLSPDQQLDAERIFVKYYREASAKRKTGSGLGLYLARSLSVLLGGRLDCVLEVPQIRFELWLTT
jgi:signal transduction histidine kinase